MRRKALLVIAAVIFCTVIVAGINGVQRWRAVGRLEKQGTEFGNWNLCLSNTPVPNPTGVAPFLGHLLHAVASPRTVYFESMEISTSMMQDLRVLGGTDSLSATYVKGLSPKVVVELSGNSSIIDLVVNGSDITDEGLNLLWCSLPKLKWMGVAGTGVGDDGLRDIACARWLESLDLTDTRITDRSMERLRVLPRLQHLDLSGTRVTEESAAALSTMPALKTVVLPTTETGVRLRERLERLNPGIEAQMND
jgi:hypothetical protein